MQDTLGVEALRRLLADTFGRVRELIVQVTDGLSDADAAYRPDERANSVGWLVWHLTRIQDDHLAQAAGEQQAWLAQGWAERFALPFHPGETGFGHSPEDVAKVKVSPALLADYHADVHAATVRFVEQLDDAELERIVDKRWDPPVTLSVRIVSVVSDCLQHAGQAAYVRGLAERSS